jgi:hypothetical protein
MGKVSRGIVERKRKIQEFLLSTDKEISISSENPVK